MSQPRRHALLLTFALLAVAAAGHAAETPLHPPRTFTLEEQWRVGGDDPETMLGLMIEATADADGNVYLLDHQLCRALVVAPGGEVLRTLAREGDGPGEVRAPQGLVLLPDGSVGFALQFPGKFVRLTREGVPVGSLTLGGDEPQTGYSFIAGCKESGGHLVVAGMRSLPAENGQKRLSYLASVGEDGRELTRFCEHTATLDFGEAHFVEREMGPAFHGAYAVDGAGRLYASLERDEYAVTVFGPDGAVERTVERPFDNWRRTDREKARIDALFEVQAEQLPFPITWHVEEYEQALTGLFVDDDDILWVSHSRSTRDLPEGVLHRYDRFDGEGRWLDEVLVAGEGNPKHDGLILLPDGRVLLVKGLVLARLTATGSQGAVFDEDEDTGPMEVICCRLVEAGGAD